MKSNIWTYVIGTTLTLAVVMGIFLTRSMTSFPPDLGNEIVALSVESSYIGRDIDLYTQSVDAIVVGNVVEVGEPYLREDRGLTSQQNIQVTVEEVLKGDKNLSELSLLIEGGQNVSIKDEQKSIVSGNDPALFTIGEHVLLFVGSNSHGDYVVFAGPSGKYLIDTQNNVTSIGDFTMSLKELKEKIKEALEQSI